MDTIEGGRPAPTWMINHLPIIFWQRRYLVLACFLCLLLAGVVAAFSLPQSLSFIGDLAGPVTGPADLAG